MLIKDVGNSILICIFVIPAYTLLRCFNALAMQLTCKYGRQEWIEIDIITKINPNNSNNFNRNDLIKEFIADFSATETPFKGFC